MANLSQETRNGKTTYRISFTDEKKNRRFIRVGKGIRERDAQVIANQIDQIISSKAAGNCLAPASIEWLRTLPDDLLEKLVKAELIEPRRKDPIGDYFEEFVTRNQSGKSKSWAQQFAQARRLIVEFFGERSIRSVTPKEAAEFRHWLEESYAQATIAGHIKKIKQVFRLAVTDGLIYHSPFAEIVAGDQTNSSRNKFVSRQEIGKVLLACPNDQWKLLVLLVRFGGLRNVSETFALKWEHIDWESAEINVPGSKGRGEKIRWRKIPIFKELDKYLRKCFDPDQEFVINGITGTPANIRDHFKRMITKAGLKPWPRIWHNLRASRDTELSEVLEIHEVAAIMGNTPKVSLMHYKSVRPERLQGLKAQRVCPSVPLFEQSETGKTEVSKSQRPKSVPLRNGKPKVARNMAQQPLTSSESNGKELNLVTGKTEGNGKPKETATRKTPRADSQRNFFDFKNNVSWPKSTWRMGIFGKY